MLFLCHSVAFTLSVSLPRRCWDRSHISYLENARVRMEKIRGGIWSANQPTRWIFWQCSKQMQLSQWSVTHSARVNKCIALMQTSTLQCRQSYHSTLRHRGISSSTTHDSFTLEGIPSSSLFISCHTLQKTRRLCSAFPPPPGIPQRSIFISFLFVCCACRTE